MQKHIIDLDVYETKIRVIVGTPEEARKYKSKSPYANVDYDFEVLGATLTQEELFPLVFINSRLSKKDRVQTLAHEFVHVINREFYRVGIETDPINDEAFAYTMSYLIREAQNKKII